MMGFWRANVPALLMVMPYTSIQFAVLHKFKTYASGSSNTEDHIRPSPYLSYVSGALAGCAATVGSYPFDLLRTILASQGEPKVYPTMRSAFLDIVRTHGFKGLYAGLFPTLVEIIPYAGLQFGTYDTFKRWSMVNTELEQQVTAEQVTFPRRTNLQYYEISAKSNHNIEKPFLYLARKLTGDANLHFVESSALAPPEVQFVAQVPLEAELAAAASPLPDNDDSTFE